MTASRSGVAEMALMLVVGLIPASSGIAAEPEFQIVTIAEGLDDPWAIAVLPDSNILVTEKSGRLRIIRDGKLDPDPVPGAPKVRVGGQGGLMDLVLAPDFDSSHLVYMTIAKPSPDDSLGTTAVVRARFDGTRLTDLEEVIATEAWGEARSHYGTRITFDGDGHLFLTIADRSSFYLTGRDLSEHPAQRLDNHMGKVLRLNADGSVPDDNPFAGRTDALPEIWTYGHRDPQGIAYRPETGAIWEVEHGPLGGDELNLLEPGLNYGWPIVSKGGNYTDVTGFASVPSREGIEEPRYFWATTIAPSNILFYRGERFPEWRGDAFISGLAGLKLTRVSFDGDTVTEVATVVEGLGRIRDVHEGPDGLLYLAITGGEVATTPILRLEPVDLMIKSIMAKLTRGIHELYGADPERADASLWGRKPEPLTRRGFLGAAGLGSLSAVLRASMPYARFFPAGMIPAALAQSTAEFEIPGKDPRLIVLNDRPVNAETPAHLLDDEFTPADRMFVRNNGLVPDVELASIDEWALEVGGESCLNPQTLTIGDLRRDFTTQTYQLQLECAGNGRSEFQPPASGNQWSTGAVACPIWIGVRLRDVLERCGVRDDAIYVAYYGSDRHLSGDPSLDPISRGVPMHKALEDESMLAWAMNGEPLPGMHGYPLRLVCGGWPGSVSGKWLRRLVVRNRIHDGEKMLGQSYRVPCSTVAPGSVVADDDMCIIESMPVKSLVTFPRSGEEHPLGEPLTVRGHAWAGDLAVDRVDVSLDFGQTWQPADLQRPANRLAWQHWTASLRFPERGYYEVWARATDALGRSQPMVLPAWNPRGYLNNAAHRVAVQIV